MNRVMPLAFFLMLAACGGTNSALLDNTNDSDASTKGDSGGSCVHPTVGESCAVSQQACSEGDACCTGHSWSCENGKWTEVAMGCPCKIEPVDAGGPFACGPSLTCKGSDYCVDQPPGIAFADGGTPPNSYECIPTPIECNTTSTCGCVSPFASCQVASCDDPNGNVTVSCLGE